MAASGEPGGPFRVRTVGAVPLGAGRRPGHVQDRGQVDVEAHQGQFPGHLPGQILHLFRGHGYPQVPGCRNNGEGCFEALDPAPFLVHRQEQGPPGGRQGLPLQVPGQLPDLLRALDITGKEDDTPNFQVPHQLPGHRIHPGAGNPHHEELPPGGGVISQRLIIREQG